MNTLSWMIYAAEVAGNLKATIGLGAVFVLFCFLMWRLFYAMDSDDDFSKPPNYLLWLAVAGAIIAAIMPSSTTIYMIAASEAGHAVAASEHGREILDAAREAIMAKLREAAQ